jgi:bifunctional non-homologous end joining protein LigD
MARAKRISEYSRKRNFAVTSEPRDDGHRGRHGKGHALQFVIQKHDARRLHYDFRLELDGTLKSWAVPKGPSLDPKDKRLAVHVEDHPLDYASFEGAIPEGQYGAGDVIVWDRGIWQPHGDARKAYREGKLKFSLSGEKLRGDWALVRTQLRGSGGKEQWLLIKERDDTARGADEYDVVSAQPASVISGNEVREDHASQARKPRRAVKIPRLLAPQLATLVDKAPAGDWLYEIKFDGYRIMTRIIDGEVRLFTRNGNDWTDRLQRQAQEIAKLNLGDSWLDGEMVVLNDEGMPDFQALQNAFDAGSTSAIHYCLFDAPFLNGQDMRHVALELRRTALQQALAGHRNKWLHFSAAFEAQPSDDVLASACEMSLEGVIGKRIGSVYSSRRSAEWIKLKCRQRQEFVVVGYTAPRGNRSGFGALLLAVNEDDDLRYAGMVGTGFSAARLKQLQQHLQRLECKASPLTMREHVPAARGVHWVKPQLVVEVEFAEWTRGGLVRQAAFVGLREDKPADAIVREKPAGARQVAAQIAAKTPTRKSSRSSGVSIAGIAISHADRVIDTHSGATKQTLAQFYQDIARLLLPQLDGRPVSIVRAPDGIDGERFFQKHAEHLSIPAVRLLDRKLDPGHAPLMEIDSVAALVGAPPTISKRPIVSCSIWTPIPNCPGAA